MSRRFRIASTVTIVIEGSPGEGRDLPDAIAEQTAGLSDFLREEFGVAPGETASQQGGTVRVDISTVGEEFSS